MKHWTITDHDGRNPEGCICEHKPTEFATDIPCIENYLKPRFLYESNIWVNEATEKEQAAHEAKCRAMANASEKIAVNFDLKSPQTSSMLNSLYPGVSVEYRVFAPNVPFSEGMAGTLYIKNQDSTWRKSPSEIV
jgi:hypothetical protein